MINFANQDFLDSQIAASDAKIRLDAEKELELPSYLQSRLKAEAETLHNILKEYGEEYQGGCTITDAKKIHEHKCKIAGLSSLLIKTENKFGNTEVFQSYGYGVIGYFNLIW